MEGYAVLLHLPVRDITSECQRSTRLQIHLEAVVEASIDLLSTIRSAIERMGNHALDLLPGGGCQVDSLRRSTN